MIGLRSVKVAFEDTSDADATISAKKYMTVADGTREPVDESWSPEVIRVAIDGWWAGERTGNQISRVSGLNACKKYSPPARLTVLAR